jgi:DNA helicase-2/ATP-dependent DNA helicase PcrA
MTEQATELLIGLNQAQQDAVTTTEGPVLVVAGPGSGKTRVLTHRIAYLIREQGVSPDQILAVTFTNKAAREMRDRVDNLVPHSAANGLVMGTFHSLGVRILRQNPGLVSEHLNLLPNFVIYDSGDQQELVKRAIIAANLDPKQLQPRRMQARISAAKSVLQTPDEFASTVETYDDELVLRIYREYERGLRNANAVDFDDLLGLPIRLFDMVPTLLERYQQRFRYIMVDEYQDTNRVQYVIVSALAAYYRNLFVVGDPDQSIYAWRHADIRNILDFEKDYPDAKQIHLELNYRSTKRIVQAADRVIRENEQRIERTIRTENEEGELISLRELPDQNAEASFIVNEIRRLMTSQGYRGDDIAIMYRTTAQSRVLEESFRVSDVPYRIVGGLRFYERKEVKDLLAVLRLLHNSYDRMAFERVIDNLPLGHGFGPKAMEAVQDWAQEQHSTAIDACIATVPSINADPDQSKPSLSAPARRAAEKIGAVFARLRVSTETSTLAELFDDIIEQTGYRDLFADGTEEDLQRWANIQELRSDLEQYDFMEPGKALGAWLEQVALVADVDNMAEDARGQVTLITLHSAKGLEFPVVFIAGVEDGLLPISRAVEAEPFDPAPMEEERRLFYVGITRAKKLLYLTFAGNRLSYGRYQMGVRSRFLESIPADAVRSVTRHGFRGGGADRMAGKKSGSLASRVTGDWIASSERVVTVPPPPSLPLPDYAVGQHVFHPKFGEGTIDEVIARNDDQELAVTFTRHGKKRLMASLARLDVLGES